ncbi:hypothetical protein [Rhodococcus sp. OK519]|uniref:hypothetical protein n=1 Tax=Rhodococcus sp. OK519 TaxID=2135729 RepID=UPI0011B22760
MSPSRPEGRQLTTSSGPDTRVPDGRDTVAREWCCALRIALLSAAAVTAVTLLFGGSPLLAATAAALILLSVVAAAVLI